jgi:CysZ protein
VIRNFLAGVGFVGKGFRAYATSPKLMWLGVLPALIVGVIYAVLVVTLALNLDGIVSAITPFATGWALEPLVRIAAGLGVVGISVIVLVYTYVAITLAVGDPFYERIWRAVETRLGGAPADRKEGFWKPLGRGLDNAIRLLLATVAVSMAIFALGFIPVVGQILAPVFGAFFGGWFLTLELTGFAFDARGLALRDRRRALAARRSRTLGFGVVVYVLFLVPFAVIFVMPAAVAGATLLARDALAESPA